MKPWGRHLISSLVLENGTTQLLIISSKCGIFLKKTSSLNINKKLDGIGPVNNRPSPDKLDHFVKKKKKKEKLTHDT